MPLVIPPDGLFHYEDFTVGETLRFDAGRRVTRDEIIAFARVYDPQPMHLDDEAAKRSMVGGLCASGFHSCALMMRILCDSILLRSASLGSPGVDECRWLKPVRPDDRLSVRYTTTAARRLTSRPGLGLTRTLTELVNQADEPVMTWDSMQFLRLRDPGSSAAEPAARRPREAPGPNLWDRDLLDPPSRTGNYFEDRNVGEAYDLGRHTFERDEIVGFARQFDPQPFHLDEAAGAKSMFGGLAASGWHTAAIYVRQLVRWRQAIEAEIRARGEKVAVWGPSPGFKALRWLKPVHPGDTIEFRGTTVDLVALRSRPTRGLVVTDVQGRNQRGDIVFRVTGQIFAERRP